MRKLGECERQGQVKRTDRL